ncbi:MAG: hypothetical protein Q7R39_09850 [Dehalococcoidia bacterium]|nr:hypothetical protein [Dehalococcoidia bacterium]
MPDFDYGGAGANFVTICSHNGAPAFNGEQVRGNAKGAWEETPLHFAHLRLGAFVVMPDHMHGVVFGTRDGRGSALRLPETTPLVSRIQPQARRAR